jgi:hypothetical protein
MDDLHHSRYEIRMRCVRPLALTIALSACGGALTETSLRDDAGVLSDAASPGCAACDGETTPPEDAAETVHQDTGASPTDAGKPVKVDDGAVLEPDGEVLDVPQWLSLPNDAGECFHQTAFDYVCNQDASTPMYTYTCAISEYPTVPAGCTAVPPPASGGLGFECCCLN